MGKMPTKKKAKNSQRANGDIITISNKGNNNAIAAGRGASAAISHPGKI